MHKMEQFYKTSYVENSSHQGELNPRLFVCKANVLPVTQNVEMANATQLACFMT